MSRSRWRRRAACADPCTGPRPLAVLALLLALAGCGTPEAIEREPPPQAQLATEVKIALVEAPEIDAAAIFVEAEDATVRLGGFADDPGVRERAIEVARGVPGVARVESRIELR